VVGNGRDHHDRDITDVLQDPHHDGTHHPSSDWRAPSYRDSRSLTRPDNPQAGPSPERGHEATGQPKGDTSMLRGLQKVLRLNTV
jgi:hypothetical protein